MRRQATLTQRRLTYREKQRLHRAVLAQKRATQAKTDRRERTALGVIGIVSLILLQVVNSAYVEDSQAFSISLWALGAPATIATSAVAMRRIPQRWKDDEAWTRLAVILGYLGVPVMVTLYGMGLFLLVNMWMPSESHWQSGVVAEKQVGRIRRSVIPLYSIVLRTPYHDVLKVKTFRERYQNVSVGDTLTLQLWTGGLGWKYAQDWIELEGQ